MDERAKTILEQGEFLFGKKGPINSLWQTMSEHFYPERASFTYDRYEGDEFADHLQTSYPSMVRRDMANQLAGMLRRGDWFDIGLRGREEPLSNRAQTWVDRTVRIQRGYMYDPRSNFVRSTKEGDHDFVTFGQNVIQPSWSVADRSMIYQTHHLKDCAWKDNYMGRTVEFHRRCKKPLRDLVRIFGTKKLHPNMTMFWPRKPHEEFEIEHIVVPAEEYNGGKDVHGKPWGEEFVSVWCDRENQHIIEETPAIDILYNIPRWQTVSGSAYAHSPASIVCLPDARLLQDMTRVLLEAGEVAVLPPMVATKNALRGDVALYAGGITYVDSEYDERLGAALEPLNRDLSGIPLGLEMAQDVKAMLAEGFYINKLTMPPVESGVTAYEQRLRHEEWVRQALPIFEPMETQYNGGICEMTITRLMRAGELGSPEDVPEEFHNQDIEFKFKSPLQTAIERQNTDKFMELQEILQTVAAVDPHLTHEVDLRNSFRDAINGLDVPARWVVDEDEAAERVDQAQQMEQLAAAAEAAGAAPVAG